MILGIDTATSAIAVALGDGGRVLDRAARIDARGHSEHLAPLIADLLQRNGTTPADVTAIAVGTGPGPFTGLRVGIVSARVMSLVTGASLHGMCSLDALAAAGPDGEVLVATDARRKEVYWARYAVSPGAVRPLSEPAVSRPAELPESVRALPTLGRGPMLYPALFPAGLDVLDVSAAALATLAVHRLAAGDPLDAREPLYLRRPDAAPHVVAKSALG